MLLGLVFPVPAVAFTPQPDYYPDPVKLPNLLYCGRCYPCGCGVRTGWRYSFDNLLSCICSTECLEAFIKEEVRSLAPTTPGIAPEPPVVPPEPVVAPIPPDVAA